jgi:hypothetical protein
LFVSFPDSEIEVEAPSLIPLTQKQVPGGPVNALFFPIRVTNREPATAMNLEFEAFYVLAFSSTSPEAQWRLAMLKIEGKGYLLPSPFKVQPNDTQKCTLALDCDWLDQAKINQLHGTQPSGGDHYELKVHDQISGKSIEFTVPGKWEARRPPR